MAHRHVPMSYSHGFPIDGNAPKNHGLWSLQPVPPQHHEPVYHHGYASGSHGHPVPVSGGQMRQWDNEMHGMTNDMSKLYQHMTTKLVPQSIGPGDKWLNEDFHMDNPIVTESDGSRKFILQFDVRQFKPEEIKLTTEDNNLTIRAKHEEMKEGRSVYREYSRSYVLPDEVEAEMLTSKLDRDGVLNIEAHLPPTEPREKVIPIEHTKHRK